MACYIYWHIVKRDFRFKSSEYVENPGRFLKTAKLFASHLEQNTHTVTKHVH